MVSVTIIIISVVKNESKSTDCDWNLNSCLAEAENFQPPSEIFAVRFLNFDHVYFYLTRCSERFRLVASLLQFDDELNLTVCHNFTTTNTSILTAFPQIDIIGAMVIVYRIRGKIIMSVLCNIVCNSCAQCSAHTYEQT